MIFSGVFLYLFLKVFIVLSFFVLVGYSVELLIRKKFGIKRVKGWLRTFHSPFHKWVIGLLTIVYIIFVVYTFNFPGVDMTLWIWYFFTVSMGIHAFMDWKYDRTSKQYIISLYWMSWTIVITLILSLWSPY